MDPSLQPLLALLGRLPDELRDIRTEVETAVRVIDQAPSLAVVPPRKVLDLVIREVYERCVNEPPGTRPLEGLTQRLVKDGHLPPGLEGYASLIRQHGNVGAHHAGQALTAASARDSLLALVPILDWYVRGRAPGTPAPPPPAPAPPARLEARVAVVPKGLRSFDANDAAFFLDLLPGPRDAVGLPESLRFWKNRVEERDEPAFTVGAIYGPSGCGKSSLVKAGLLPRLARRVLPVYVEATAADTEARLLKGLRKHCPDLPGDRDLTGTMAALRERAGPSQDQKVLIVLDQFEQWLHAKRGEGKTELAQALRQCDGEHVQCIVLVRDDFWLGLSRFMSALDIELVQGQNIALVDLFDPMHARTVLAAFGRAFGRLPADPSREQESFLDQAVAGLSQDGRVVPVRLALFAEMVKGREWTPATLKAVGGTEGVGASFLDETFAARTASPRHRAHEQAARAVLKALLPERGSDIKGNMQSRGKLLEVSGYARRPQDFEELLRILDGEVRLITPTEPAEIDTESGPAPVAPGERYYQLTHDYLVHSLRDWLSRKQRETWRGRAELRLAERAALWGSKPERRHLPAGWEWLNIRLLTRKRDWTTAQRKMMRQARRLHLVRGAIFAVVLAALTFVGLAIRDRVGEQNDAAHAEGLVDTLLKEDITQVPETVAQLEHYRRWADARLRKENEQAADNSPQKLHTALALLPVDDSQVEYLYGRLLGAAPREVPVLCEQLAPHQDKLRERLWATAEQPPPGKEGQRLPAACGLAMYAQNDDRWDRVRDAVATDLVTAPAFDLAAWAKALRPVRGRLLPPLVAIFHDANRSQSERSQATDVLADYAADRPETLADLLMSADERQWARLWPGAAAQPERIVSSFSEELDKALAPDWHDAPFQQSGAQPEPLLVRQIEGAAGMVAERFVLCQTLPLGEFDALAKGLQKAGYRLLQLRPYHVGRAPGATPAVRVAALWTRDGQEAPWACDLTADEAMRRDAAMRERGLEPRDVAGYLPLGGGKAEPRYAVLWGAKEAGSQDVKMYVGVPGARLLDEQRPLFNDGYIPRTQSQVAADGASRHSAVWWQPARRSDSAPAYGWGLFYDAWSEEKYEQEQTPTYLQTDLRLAWNPGDVEAPRRLDAPLTHIPEPELEKSGEPAPPPPVPGERTGAARSSPAGVEFAAVWIESGNYTSDEVHGLDPAAHLARCRDLAARGYRPAALTLVEDGGGRLLSGSVWHLPVVTEPAKDALAKRQAQAAVALLRLGAPERVWPLLEHKPDPRLRSFLVHRLAQLAADPALLLERLEAERDVSRRRALVLSLGAYPVDRLGAAVREKWLGRLRRWYRDEPDAGLHGAVEWLLRRWGEGSDVVRIEKELARSEADRATADAHPKGWYVNGQGQTLVLVPGSAEFWMGMQAHELTRYQPQPSHLVRIPRSFSIAAKEVTIKQFRLFRPGHPAASSEPDGPVVHVTWYDAARYCNWLSEQEGIPREEWCYEEAKDDAGSWVRLVPGALAKRGYRLPTEAEWEYACRAGAVTRRYYGDTDELLGEYAWYRKTTNDASVRATGVLKPNDRGLFDLYGNATEWVLDPALGYRWPGRGQAEVDKERPIDTRGELENFPRVLRGGAYDDPAQNLSSAIRANSRPGDQAAAIGFRVAKTEGDAAGQGTDKLLPPVSDAGSGGPGNKREAARLAEDSDWIARMKPDEQLVLRGHTTGLRGLQFARGNRWVVALARGDGDTTTRPDDLKTQRPELCVWELPEARPLKRYTIRSGVA